MKHHHYIILFLACFLLWTCSKEKPSIIDPINKDQEANRPDEPNEPEVPEEPEEQETEVYFTYNRITYGGNEEWIILHDENGNVLDYKSVKSGETVHFEATENEFPKQITATQMYLSLTSGIAEYKLYTFINLEPGSVWSRHTSVTPEYTTNGTFDLTIHNIFGGVRNYTRSTSLGSFNYGSTSFPGSMGDLAFRMGEIPIIENEDYIFSVYDGIGNNKYIILDGPEEGKEYTYDFSDLQEYDNYLEVELPVNKSIYAATFGFEEEEPDYSNLGYQMSGDGSSSPTSTKLGFLDKFPKYATLFVLNMEDYFYTLYQTGDKPEDLFVLPKPSLSLEESSINNFQFSTNTEFVRKRATWSYTSDGNNLSNTEWFVASSGDKDHRVGMLPEEIVDRYPNLNLDKITLESMELFIQSASHQDYFSTGSTGVFHSEERTTETIRFTF